MLYNKNHRKFYGFYAVFITEFVLSSYFTPCVTILFEITE